MTITNAIPPLVQISMPGDRTIDIYAATVVLQPADQYRVKATASKLARAGIR
jgi:hypothetical protein